MNDEKHAVLEIERTRVEALLRHDVAALDRMMAEECVHTESNGTLRTKAQFLTAFAAQEFAFTSFIIKGKYVTGFSWAEEVLAKRELRAGGRLATTPHSADEAALAVLNLKI